MYKILASVPGTDWLEKQVNDALKQGWIPIGGVAVDSRGTCYQAVYKEKK